VDTGPSQDALETEKGETQMQWEMILLLVLASPFVFYYVIRHGIGRLKKSTTEK
jgi:hypothetical protein